MRNKITKQRKYKTLEDIATNGIRKNYMINARHRDLSFDLSHEDFQKLILDKCSYCGKLNSNTYKSYNGNQLKYNGVDRKDSSLGYSLDNCIPCCKRCNQMKSSMDSESFLGLIESISQNQRVKNTISEKKLNYYYERALATSNASPDPSTKVGALLIHGESGAVIAEGYNGFIRGAPDDLLPKTRPEKYDYIIHAEMNLICNAVRHGISTDKCVIFCTISPCIKCMRALYQAGITTVYVKGFYSDFEKCSSMMDLSLSVTKIGEFSMMVIKPNRAGNI